MTSINRLVLIATLSLLPLQWVIIANLGGIEIKASNVLIPFIILIACFKASFFQHILKLVRESRFVKLYFIYLAILFLSITWTESIDLGFKYFLKNSVYFIYFLCLTAFLVELSRSNEFNKSIFQATVLSISTFTVSLIIIFSLLGRSFAIELYEIIKNGDARSLQFLFNPVFNYGVEREGSMESFNASLRNTVTNSFILFFQLIVIQSKEITRFNLLRLFAQGMCILFIVLSISRSNILSFLLVLVALVSLSKTDKRVWASYFCIGIPCLILFFFLIEGSLFEIIEERLLSLQDDSRFQIYSLVFNKIQASPFLGYGLGAEIDFFIWQTQAHNIFLNSWFQAGFLGLIFSIAYYLGIVADSISFYSTQKSNYFLVIALLVILPLFRSLISATGLFNIIEWTFLSFFYFYLLKNREGHKSIRC